METNLMKYQAFLESCRTGSFTRAARRLSYSQSGVSRMVADLEQDWGMSLLERGRGPLRLTPDGERLRPLVREVCEADRRLRMQVDDIRGIRAGTVRIGCFSSVATHWLPEVMRGFSREYPDVDYELLMGDYAEIESWCAEGRVDLGFLPFVPKSPLLRTHPLTTDELMAVLPEGHRLADKAGVPVEELCEEPFIMLRKSGDTEVVDIFSRAGLRPRVRFTTFDDYAIMSMVESGLGLAVLPALILRRNPYHLAVRHVEPRAFRTIGVVSRRAERPSVAAARFIEHLDAAVLTPPRAPSS
ncbi:LysR family transcriptional regulator [Olsenella sp. HMSC062G07]|uniref:LysR family transcriptional regulator n=1 Tax=Olsenella sp. HMSC062G07 TaxID=1739330 RepID=UPI0008A23917|nr:LysR family transcriptional regulator [Olsenella sp. HMSC062G07]OFK22340.1 LysR family transcriptional regulator [Olsenella sp. HMSC062G07]